MNTFNERMIVHKSPVDFIVYFKFWAVISHSRFWKW